jgi:hypothetical protein
MKGRDLVSMTSDNRADDKIFIACKKEDLSEPPRIGKDLRMPNAQDIKQHDDMSANSRSLSKEDEYSQHSS